MAALPSGLLTLADLGKFMDPDGKAAAVVNILAQRGTKSWLQYFGWREGNLPTGHQFTQYVQLPTANLRDYGEYVAPSAAKGAQIREGMSIIESWFECDAAEINLNGNKFAFLAQQSVAFIESLEQEFSRNLIYGNPDVSSKEFRGLATRLNAMTVPNVFDAGGDNAATNTSIYCANLGEDVFGIYPKGSDAGLKTNDFGVRVDTNSAGGKMAVHTMQFVWNCGLVVRHPQRIGRIANIKVADLRARSSTQALTASTNILYQINNLLESMPDGLGQKVLVCNATVAAALRNMMMDKSASALSVMQAQNQLGKPYSQLMWNEFPILVNDRILNTESKVV